MQRIIMLAILAGTLTAGRLEAQPAAPTHEDVFRTVLVDAFTLLQRATFPTVYRISPASVAKVDGLERFVEVTIATPSSAAPAEFNRLLRAELQPAVAALALKIKPFHIIGTPAHTSSGSDSIIHIDWARGLVLRGRLVVSTSSVTKLESRKLILDVIGGK